MMGKPAASAASRARYSGVSPDRSLAILCRVSRALNAQDEVAILLDHLARLADIGVFRHLELANLLRHHPL